MNNPLPLDDDDDMPLPAERLARLQAAVARLDPVVERIGHYKAVAQRFVDLKLPRRTRTPHGFYEFPDFVEAARHENRRQFMFWLTFALLRARREGGKPYISLPKHSEHSLGGTCMWRVSKALEAHAG